MSSNGSGSSNAWKVIGFLAVVVGLYVAARFLDLESQVEALRSWIQSIRPWSPAVFAGLYVAAIMVGAPGMPLTLLAALIFGTLEGIIVMIIATTAAAVLGFFVARYVARDAVERWLGNRTLYRKLADHIESDGILMLAIARLLPLFPTTLVNYTYGLAPISFWKYIIISEFVMIPMNVAYIAGGDAAIQAITRGEIPWGLLGIAVGVSAVLLALTYAARAWLRRHGKMGYGGVSTGERRGHRRRMRPQAEV